MFDISMIMTRIKFGDYIECLDVVAFVIALNKCADYSGDYSGDY